MFDLPLMQKLYECPCDGDSIMRYCGSLNSVCVHFVVEDADVMSVRYYFDNDFSSKLGMPLYCYIFSGGIHGLHSTNGVAAQRNGAFGEFSDDIAVHLLNGLCNVSASHSGSKKLKTRTIFSSPKISLPFGVSSTSVTAISQPLSLRPSLALRARPTI